MYKHLIVIAVFAAGLALWVLFQRWIANTDPDIRGPEDSANGCGSCGSDEPGGAGCQKRCQS